MHLLLRSELRTGNRRLITFSSFAQELKVLDEETGKPIYNVNVFTENISVIENGSGSSNGNGDGQINSGEVVDLIIPVSNYGNANAVQINGTLTSENSNVTVVNDTYLIILYGNPFGITVDICILIFVKVDFSTNYFFCFELVLKLSQLSLRLSTLPRPESVPLPSP